MAPSSNLRSTTTIRQCLGVLGIDNHHFLEQYYTSRHEEFNAVIKKQYFRAVLQHHPDKGGNDLDLFRSIQTSFEFLRDLHHGTHHQQRANTTRTTRSRNKTDDWLFSDYLLGDKVLQHTKKSPDSSSKKNKAKKKATSQTTSSSQEEQYDNDEEEEVVNDVDDGDHQDDFEFDLKSYYAAFATMEAPSWEYYEEASKEDVPLYRMELAKSSRSTCTQTGKTATACRESFHRTASSTSPTTTYNTSLSKLDKEYDNAIVEMSDSRIIIKGEIRVGWMNGQSGSYGGWVHLRCWRVPFKVWLGLPNPDECNDATVFEGALLRMNDIVLSGIAELSKNDRDHVVRHVMNKEHWARRTNPKKTESSAETTTTTSSATSTSSSPSFANESEVSPDAAPSSGDHNLSDRIPDQLHSSSAVAVPQRQRFVIPIPGRNGASPATVFCGKTFVLTGVFPEIGGGKGLSLGKDKTKALIVAFGGRVTSSISGKTDVLVVGKEPGMSKVSKARSADHITMVSLKDLQEGIEGGCLRIEDFPVWSREQPMLIQNFSAGYNGSGLALKASKKELAIAQGFVALAKKIDVKKKASPRVTIKKENSSIERKMESSTGPTKRSLRALPEVSYASLRKRRHTSTQSVGATCMASLNSSAMVLARPKKKGKQQEFNVSCDGCAKDCTAISWFYPQTEKDFCEECHLKQADPDVNALRQFKGRTVTA